MPPSQKVSATFAYKIKNLPFTAVRLNKIKQ